MRICIIGAGKMGSFFADSMCLLHEVAIYDVDIKRLQYVFNTRRLTTLDEIRDFNPELVINAVTLKYTLKMFHDVLPYLSENCLLSDIASVKTGLKSFYETCGHPFVSTHPMFGPTFANLRELSKNHAIIIAESDPKGKEFFRDFYGSLNLNLHEYTFDGHDETMTYALSIPFVSSMVFAASMRYPDAPGTTFTKHLDTAKGVLSEDDYLTSEILFSPYTPDKIENVISQMTRLKKIIEKRDSQEMKDYLAELRKNIFR
ncbi:MAG: prephenate dehydrogenase/arogenate dehydrogenase family protein [Bacteroidales bacterium]|nr:prephenate dehydrogenase/arogenate dehydrogenase family protein [Bacteroidales bacterium]